ncbi:hypothetical protein SKAU_G00305890 [Synaphobranchus kaupii]|uniref:C2 domain-containing protein n=1 Tax=Synaphobranchus kaupii TaxID=118154 RepID=A0A9Q1EQS9_SYNKA|nr:hypothetical protein SKAU_G00305890 [Synaphobranchus kaupii]
MPQETAKRSPRGADSTVTPTPAFNSTTTASPGFIAQLFNRIPRIRCAATVPRWAVYAILALILLLLLACFLCICVKCCCKGRRKRKQKEKLDGQISLTDVNGASDAAELVQPETEDSLDTPTGRLLYSLEYSPQSSEVTVGVMEAAGLKAMDLGGTSDPYVKIYNLPNTTKTYETKVFRNTLNPVFNEHFTFQISQVELSSSTPGTPGVRLQQEWRDLSEASNYEENFGEVCFSLRYVPTTKKLSVVILEARNLKKMDIGGLADPYVKVQLILDRKKWKRNKTTVKKGTLNPYFNEKFSFNVSFHEIQRVQLVVAVWDHDKMSRNEAMGKVLLGCGATGNPLQHWADMLSNPRRPLAQWHTLLSAEQVDSTLQLKRSLRIPFVNKTF